MANVKKQKGIALLTIAIVLIAAAIIFVVYSGLTTAAFENAAFEEALTEALDEFGSIEKSDLEEVKYLKVANDGQSLSVFLGYDDFITQRTLYIEEQEMINEIKNANAEAEAAAEEQVAEENTADETTDEAADEIADEATDEATDEAEKTEPVLQEVPEETVKHPEYLAKKGTASSSASLITLDDIKYFTGAKVISLVGAKLDIDNFTEIKGLTELSFQNCSIENFDSFSKLNLDKFESITFYDCSFDSESYDALKPIADKVTFTISYDLGNGMVYPISYTLAEYIEQEAAADEASVDETPVDETSADETSADEASVDEIPVDEIPVDTQEPTEEPEIPEE